MRKNLLSFFLISSMALGAMAETANIDFTYADGELYGFGKGKKENIDVAMCINNPAFSGMKLKGFSAYLNTTEGLSSTSLWMSSELKLEDKMNVADIASFDVTPVAGTYGDENLGVMTVQFEEPYILTESPLYLGYSITVDETATDGQKNPVIIANNINPNGLFVHMSKSVLKWLDYSESAGGVALIVAYIEGDFPDVSLSFQSFKPAYASENEPFEIEFAVTNTGGNAVKDINYAYTFDGNEKIYEGSVTLPVPMEPNMVSAYPVTLPFEAVSGLGTHAMNVTITEVNGMNNESASPSIDCEVKVIPFVPVHRPLVEEFTGLWCGWCTRGYIAMEMIAEDYGDSQVSICYHNGDPMTVTNDYPVNVSGFPSSSIDRISIIDPYYGSYDDVEFGISVDLENAMSTLPEASIDVTAQLDGTTVSATSTVKFIENIEDANYQIGYVLVCNGLKDDTWSQKNYYSGESGYQGTPLEVLTTWDKSVKGLVFNDVAVDVKAMSGVEGSLPTSIKLNEEYTNTITFDISENELVQNPLNLVVTTFVINKSTRKIVNANKMALDPAGVEMLPGEVSVVAREFYDLTGRKVANPGQGIYIKTERLSDGTVKTTKVLRNR